MYCLFLGGIGIDPFSVPTPAPPHREGWAKQDGTGGKAGGASAQRAQQESKQWQGQVLQANGKYGSATK